MNSFLGIWIYLLALMFIILLNHVSQQAYLFWSPGNLFGRVTIMYLQQVHRYTSGHNLLRFLLFILDILLLLLLFLEKTQRLSPSAEYSKFSITTEQKIRVRQLPSLLQCVWSADFNTAWNKFTGNQDWEILGHIHFYAGAPEINYKDISAVVDLHSENQGQRY